MKKQITFLVSVMVFLLIATGCSNYGQNSNITDEAISSTETDKEKSTVSTQADRKANSTEGLYTFELDENVARQSVSYPNRYGITLVADLYTPKDLDTTKQYPAIVVGPPYSGVKEQGPGIYANELAQRGFIVLAFDPSYNGESAGEPRHVSSPDIFVEDFSAGVDYLGCLEYVDRSQIGAIGICGSGGFALSAAQIDTLHVLKQW